MSLKPDCYTPEENVGYPLCIGQGKEECLTCNLFADMETNHD